MKRFAFYFLVSSLFSFPASAERYYSVPEVLQRLFPQSKTVTPEKRNLSDEQLHVVVAALHSNDVKKAWTIYAAKTDKRIDGYAIVDNVLGREKPITYVVSISPDGVVLEVEIIEYRESHGGEVKNEAFRKQFAGKTPKDTLRVDQDIRRVSGATISSKSIAFGVKRALSVWAVLFR